MRMPEWIRKRLLAHVLKRFEDRGPDLVIGDPENPYLLRQYVFKTNFFAFYYHIILRDDQDFALHDHPYLGNISLLLRKHYWEITDKGKKLHPEGSILVRLGRSPHRLIVSEREDYKIEPTVTIFICGPRVFEWGFYCPKGWISHKRFIGKSDTYGGRAVGCGEMS